jgi:hypothetical protein
MSINKITYLHQVIPNKLFCFGSFMFSPLYFSDIIELKLFLNNLENDKVYVLTFELSLTDLESDDEDSPVITLSKPILITKNSSPKLLSQFLLHQISLADNKFDLNYDILKDMSLNKGAPLVLIKYNYINLF